MVSMNGFEELPKVLGWLDALLAGNWTRAKTRPVHTLIILAYDTDQDQS